MQILLILILYFYQIISAVSVLENVCNAYKNASLNFTTTAFFDNQCFMIFRILQIPYLNIKPMCDETMKNASASCQVIHFNGSTIIQDFLISQLNLLPNDRFYTGLSRDSCSSSWLWQNYDNTTSPFVSSIITLPEPNTDCEENVQGYDSGTLGAVPSATFNATAFICECSSTSNPTVPPSTPSPTRIVATAAMTTVLPTIPPTTIQATTTATPAATTSTTTMSSITVTTSIAPVKNSKNQIFYYNFEILILLLFAYFII